MKIATLIMEYREIEMRKGEIWNEIWAREKRKRTWE